MGPRDPRARRAGRDVCALVFAGGDPPEASTRFDEPADLVVAADSGLAHAQTLGIHVDVVVGDLDSVDPDALDAAVAAGASVERHPAAKDATDLELALDAAIARGATTVHVAGAHGGRLDHFFANVLLLASPRYATARIDAHLADTGITVIHDRAELVGTRGGLCSLLPIGGPATGVETDGLRYPLRRETLEPGSTRGVSNEFLRDRASVAVETGVLLAIIPHALRTPDVLPTTRPGKDA